MVKIFPNTHSSTSGSSLRLIRTFLTPVRNRSPSSNPSSTLIHSYQAVPARVAGAFSTIDGGNSLL